MVLLIIGIIVAAIGVGLWVAKGKKEGKASLLATTDTSDVKDVNELYESMRNSVGDGSFTHFVELKGKAHSETPLTSELSNERVVYYKSKVVHEFKKLEEKKDSNGNIKKDWVNRKETVSENTRWADGFGINDDTGFIEIDATKAELHTEQLYSNFEAAGVGDNSAMSLKIGNFSIGMGQKNPGIKTIGYRSEEHGIRMNTRIYVTGDANDRDHRLIVSKPQDSGQPFIVSVKSEEEITQQLDSGANGMKWGAYICWGGGAGLVIAGLLKILGVF